MSFAWISEAARTRGETALGVMTREGEVRCLMLVAMEYLNSLQCRPLVESKLHQCRNCWQHNHSMIASVCVHLDIGMRPMVDRFVCLIMFWYYSSIECLHICRYVCRHLQRQLSSSGQATESLLFRQTPACIAEEDRNLRCPSGSSALDDRVDASC